MEQDENLTYDLLLALSFLERADKRGAKTKHIQASIEEYIQQRTGVTTPITLLNNTKK